MTARIARPAGLVALLAALLSLAGGCSQSRFGVEPWEREILSQVGMELDTLDDEIDDHIYFSREASSGGRGFGGGGCGCN